MAGYVGEGYPTVYNCMNDVEDWSTGVNVNYTDNGTDEELPFDVGDLPVDIRLKIDEIIRNHQDLESQMDAIDALIYGSRRMSDADAESGIDTCDSDSATASVTSSEYAVSAAVVVPTPAPRLTTALSVDVAAMSDTTTVSESDDLDEFIRRNVVLPPPSGCVDELPPAAVVPPPIDGINILPGDYMAYSLLPPLPELPEDDTASHAIASPYTLDIADCSPVIVPPPPPGVDYVTDQNTDGVLSVSCEVNSFGDLTPDTSTIQQNADVDENANSVRSSGGTDTTVKTASPQVAPKPRVRTPTAESPSGDVSGSVSATLTVAGSTATTSTSTTTTAPVLPSDNSREPFSYPPLIRHYSGETEAENSRKRTRAANMWKRLMKRDTLSKLESGSAPPSSSPGISLSSLFAHKKSVTIQSSSVAESTATLPRRPKDLLLLQTNNSSLVSASTQSKVAALAAAKARDRQAGSSATLSPYFGTAAKDVSPKAAARMSSTIDSKHLTSAAHCTDVARVNERDDESSGSDEETAVLRAKQSYRDEHGRLINAAIGPRIVKASSLVCLPSIGEEKRNSPKASRHSTVEATATLSRSGHWPPGFTSKDSSTSSKKMSLAGIGGTLPRFHRKTQSLNDDQSPSSQRSFDTAISPGQDAEDGDMVDVRRSEYLNPAASKRVRPSPAADTTQLMRRCMSDDQAPTIRLRAFLDALRADIYTANDDQQSQVARTEQFITFGGELKPIRWSEDDPNVTGSKRARSQSVGQISATGRRPIPVFVDVPRAAFGVSDARAPEVPVAAPRSLNSSVLKDTQKLQQPDKPQKPARSRLQVKSGSDRASDQAETMVSDVTTPTDQLTTDDSAVHVTDMTRALDEKGHGKMALEMADVDIQSDDVFVAGSEVTTDSGSSADDIQQVLATTADERRTAPDYGCAQLTTQSDLTAYDVIRSVASKNYVNCAFSEATSDIELLTAELKRFRRTVGKVDVTTLPQDSDMATDLSASVRQLVTDSKNLVAGAMSSSADQLHTLVDTTMHTMAGVFLHCCRFLAESAEGAAADLVDLVVEAALALRKTVDAARTVVDAAASDAGEVERSKNSLVATAAPLAKSLSVLMQKVRTT